MSLTTENIDKIAHLARLGLSGDDRTRYTDSLNSILGLIDDLQAVNTQGIEPLAHAFEVNQPLRKDMVSEQNRRDDYQKIAPAVEAGLYLVPKVIE
ncbi:MAG: Asp-tRNA(Asn)/Glu-tRNA(Gln) amidotransferase subunit GatC [Fluviicoccus sp.]|uniref:Asp-tRNA(Asn)/Glu-tRNA(Gln) amidotransferase subunit GatC n=1 Tax=Fluviicoccus sp. TaxID=2003552 RepID=UPI002726BD1D|nr:Asp-tRNA(Asn)/Glu-tRNA(Gln) amidotransferase subunit GatC [Fluviicoccus sp.]MDO8329164.1 Asp-tRNA(Asn)/Glu-tRNA(Gln) amidotransferase subunit GatC [Fluviicoccus sp.]